MSKIQSAVVHRKQNDFVIQGERKIQTNISD